MFTKNVDGLIQRQRCNDVALARVIVALKSELEIASSVASIAARKSGDIASLANNLISPGNVSLRPEKGQTNIKTKKSGLGRGGLPSPQKNIFVWFEGGGGKTPN